MSPGRASLECRIAAAMLACAACMRVAAAADPPPGERPAPAKRSADSRENDRPRSPVALFGEKLKGRNIAYVVAASGGVAQNDAAVRSAIKQSVLGLDLTQQYNVFYSFSRHKDSEEQYIVRAYQDDLAQGSLDGKVAFMQWIDRQVGNGERGDALLAFRRALRGHPDVLYFVTDGDFEDSETEDLARVLNASAVRFCCVLVEPAGAADSGDAARARAEKLALAADGRLRLVGRAELDAAGGAGARHEAPISAATDGAAQPAPAQPPARRAAASRPAGPGLWGVPVTGDRIVYVIDFSGSLITLQADLKRELKRAIDSLEPAQSFDVILFFEADDNSPRIEAFSESPVAATAEAKRRLATWLDRKTPTGRSDPVAAMQRALAMRPDAAILVSDGLFEDHDAAEEIRKANKARSHVHCVVLDDALASGAGIPRETEGSRRMAQIAEQNGGKVKLVGSADLDGD